MRQSVEIEAVIRRAWDVVLSGDEVAFRNLVSTDPNSRFIAMADGEWWLGDDAFIHLMIQRAEEIGFDRIEYDRLEAFEHGDVGWAAAIVSTVDAAGTWVSFRFTATLVVEAGAWRIVQMHSSIGVSNADAFGHEITTSLDGLVSSLDASAADLITRASASGTVTLMFTDIENSTRTSESLGDDAWFDLVREHFDVLRGIVESFDGTLIKTMGDGAMVAFPAARNALRAAVVIQLATSNSGLSVRIGVHTGDAMYAAGDYVGITVNKAARIASAADGGEVLASMATVEMLSSSELETGPERSLELKGLAGTHRVVPIVGR